MRTILRIDRERFFMFAFALAACRSSHPADRPRVVSVLPVKRVDDQAPREQRSTAGAALRARCDALPQPSAFSKQMCGDDDARGPLCHAIVEEHVAEVAEAVVDCFGHVDSGCAYCALLVCRWDAIERAPQRAIPECDPIREPDAPALSDACDRYASTLSRRGLEKLAHCLATAPAPGVECYTDSSLTPCSERDVPTDR